jgi:RNA-directed DNA polymerase
MMSKLKLTVNETKTRLCHLPDEPFDFLGYTLGRNYGSSGNTMRRLDTDASCCVIMS